MRGETVQERLRAQELREFRREVERRLLKEVGEEIVSEEETYPKELGSRSTQG